ncbi:helix-turn-helix transcriptional regulator [bacterium]|nr:helix-turn-helix transcriptional regulator [bacterium]
MANSTTEILKHNIKLYRNKRGLTQEQLGERCGVSTDYISELERGKKTPSIKRLDMIARALNIEIYKFFIEIN